LRENKLNREKWEISLWIEKEETLPKKAEKNENPTPKTEI
jgi:hypothetical protein